MVGNLDPVTERPANAVDAVTTTNLAPRPVGRPGPAPPGRLRSVRGLRAAEFHRVDAAQECHQRVRQGQRRRVLEVDAGREDRRRARRSGSVGIASRLAAGATHPVHPIASTTAGPLTPPVSLLSMLPYIEQQPADTAPSTDLAASANTPIPERSWSRCWVHSVQPRRRDASACRQCRRQGADRRTSKGGRQGNDGRRAWSKRRSSGSKKSSIRRPPRCKPARLSTSRNSTTARARACWSCTRAMRHFEGAAPDQAAARALLEAAREARAQPRRSETASRRRARDLDGRGRRDAQRRIPTAPTRDRPRRRQPAMIKTDHRRRVGVRGHAGRELRRRFLAGEQYIGSAGAEPERLYGGLETVRTRMISVPIIRSTERSKATS